MYSQVFKISVMSSLLALSNTISAAYFPVPAIPDYDIVTTPCHAHYHRHLHHTTKQNHYNVDKYYVYNTPDGDLVWVPAPCDCNGTWVRIHHTRSAANFSHEPDGDLGYIDRNNDELDPNFDTSTSDDVE